MKILPLLLLKNRAIVRTLWIPAFFFFKFGSFRKDTETMVKGTEDTLPFVVVTVLIVITSQ